MKTLERVFHSVEKENIKNNKLVKKTDELVFNDDEDHNNRVMDLIIEFKGIINKVNDGYLRLYDILQDVFEVEATELTEKESSFLDQLISELSKMNKQTSLFFSKLSKEKFLREGCKSDLLDLRINIRSMRETIGDIDSKLVNIDEETDALLNDLLAQF